MPLHRSASLAVRAAALSLCAACAGRDAPPPGAAADTATPVRGGVAVVAELADLSLPMPIVDESSFDLELVDILYMGLTRGAWREGRLVPLLAGENPMAMAERWSWANTDSTAIRFRLRPGLRWSDGRPITPLDVVWTYDMVRDTTSASTRLESTSLIDSVRAQGDTAVTIHFARRSPDMWTQTQLPIAPRHPYDGARPAELRTHPALRDLTRMVVSGPFRIARRRPGERVDLAPNPHFPVRPHLDGLVFRIVPEPTARVAELQTGQVDVARPVAPEHVAALRQRLPGVRVYREQEKNWDYVAYNPVTVEAFRDPVVRRALGMALDVSAIRRGLGMEEFTHPAGGPYGRVFGPLHDPAGAPPLLHDSAGARRLLASRGWSDADGDGILDRAGTPLRFRLTTNSGNARRHGVIQVVQQQWARIGVDARIEQVETNTFSEALIGKTYEAAVGGWAVALDPDLAPILGSDSPLNIVSFRDPEVERLWGRAREQPTAELAAPFWRSAARRIVAAQPYTWLYFYDGLSAGSDRLRGVRVDTYGAYQNVWEWWIPADRRLPRDRVQ